MTDYSQHDFRQYFDYYDDEDVSSEDEIIVEETAPLDSDHDFKQYFDYYDDEEDEKEEIDLDDIDYATKASYGAAQETTIGGNIFRMAKAAVLAGTSDKSWSETLDEMEKERQAEIDEQFPLLANLKESEEDLAILSGRLGVAVADPVTFAMPWLKVAKAGSVGARVAKTAALGAGVSVGDTALREKVVYGEVSPTSLGIAATVGGASSVLGLGVQQGINFVQRKRTVANALKDVEPEDAAKTNVTIDASTAKPVEDAVNTAADEVGFNAAEVGAKNSFLPEYLAATEAIKKERAELNKLIKETKDEVALTDLKAKRSSLSSKQTALNKKIKQETIGLIDQKNEVNIRALELLAENESFSTKAARAIMSEATKPLIGATGGFIHGAGFREDAQDVETLYVSMAIGAGLGAAWKRIDASDAITSINKDTAKMAINEAGFNYNTRNLKTLFGTTTATRLDSYGGWNKVIGNLTFSRFGQNTDSVEARTLRAQSEWIGKINGILKDSGKDDDLMEIVGEAMYGFIPKGSLVPGYKGLNDTLKGITQEQVDEVKRIVPLLKTAQEQMKTRAGASGIKYEEIDFYGMSVRHDFSKSRNAKEIAEHKDDLMEAVAIHNKNNPDAKLNATQYANQVLDLSNSKAGKYVSSSSGASPFKYNKEGRATSFRRAADFFEFERKLTDPEALEYLASKGRINLNARDVIQDYGSSSLKVFEFADMFGPNGEVINLALKGIKSAFKGKKAMGGESFAGEKYTRQLTNSIEAYWGGYGSRSVLEDSTRVLTSLANTTYLGLVTLANVADLAQPFYKSGFGASAKTLLQKGTGKSFAKMSHFQYDKSFERELDTLLKSRPVSDQRLATRASDWVNKRFFQFVGLKTLNNVSRKFAYDVGVNRAFDMAKKFRGNKKLSKVIITELEDMGLNVNDLRKIARYSTIEEAFDEKNARSVLDIAGRKVAERDVIVPNVGNRLLFTQTNNSPVRAMGQFLSWAQAKSAEVNALTKRIENGDTATLVRMAAVTPVLIGWEQFRQWAGNDDFYYDRPQQTEGNDFVKDVADGLQRTATYAPWFVESISSIVKYNTGLIDGRPRFDAAESVAPALAFVEEMGTGLVKAGLDAKAGDWEGATKEVIESGILPLGKQALKGIKGVTGKDLFYDEPETTEEEVLQFKKGGEVDIERAASEPDERIDKMTGMPYDQQAGTAFVDEEDPLRRMGFGKGGGVDPLRRLGFGHGGKVLNVLQDRKVSNG
tara:strand:+ start:7500 stop:11213 length:3714 start_codon:yes stop_codon:yes gene_type:complete